MKYILSAAALVLTGLVFSGCVTPEQLKAREWKKVDEKRDITLGYIGSCAYEYPASARKKPLEGVCVDFYANITTTMDDFKLRNCVVRDTQCDRMTAEYVCLDPSNKGTAAIQYEFLFPDGTPQETLDVNCNNPKYPNRTLESVSINGNG